MALRRPYELLPNSNFNFNSDHPPSTRNSSWTPTLVIISTPNFNYNFIQKIQIKSSLAQLSHSLFVHFSTTSSWLVHNWFTTSSRLAHNLFMTCSGFVHNFDNWFSSCSWLFHDLFTACSQLIRIFSQYSYNPIMTCSQFVHNFFTTCSLKSLYLRLLLQITSVRYHFPVNYFSYHYFTCNYFSCNYLTYIHKSKSVKTI